MLRGGSRFRATALIDADARAAIADLTPLHQPRALAGIDAAALLPGAPAVAWFDTAFHARPSEAVATYALPMAWPERFGRRHYGLHGLSHAYALRRGRACRPFSRTAPHSALPPGSWRLAGGRFRPASRSPPPRASRPWRTRRHGPPRAAVITTPGRRSVSTCTGCATRSPTWTGRTCWCSPTCRCRRGGRVSVGIVINEDGSAAHDDRQGQRDPVCASARLAVTYFTLAFSAGRSVPARAAIADPGVPRVRSGRPSAIVDARTSPVGSDTGC